MFNHISIKNCSSKSVTPFVTQISCAQCRYVRLVILYTLVQSKCSLTWKCINVIYFFHALNDKSVIYIHEGLFLYDKRYDYDFTQHGTSTLTW
jgi:hypothetical protein